MLGILFAACSRDRVLPAARRCSGEDGFTLIEVLVAFFVLALVTVTIQSGVGGSLAGLAKVRSHAGAELVLRGLMTGPLGIDPLANPQTSGENGPYAWTMELEPLSLPTEAPAPVLGAEAPVWVPARVVIEVRLSGSAAVVAQAETIRLVRRAAP